MAAGIHIVKSWTGLYTSCLRCINPGLTHHSFRSQLSWLAEYGKTEMGSLRQCTSSARVLFVQTEGCTAEELHLERYHHRVHSEF